MPPRDRDTPINHSFANYDNIQSFRNAQEIALMAEERWLIDTLKRIRLQRNSLKVEALYYQGLKADLFARHATEFGNGCEVPISQPITIEDIEFEPIPEPTYPGMLPDQAPTNSQRIDEDIDMYQQIDSTFEDIPSNIDDFNIIEGQCNNQELQDLNMAPDNKDNWDIEDPEYESEEDEYAWQNVNIEMSMLVGNDE